MAREDERGGKATVGRTVVMGVCPADFTPCRRPERVAATEPLRHDRRPAEGPDRAHIRLLKRKGRESDLAEYRWYLEASGPPEQARSGSAGATDPSIGSLVEWGPVTHRLPLAPWLEGTPGNMAREPEEDG